MEKVIKFSGWTPSPNTVTIGMERDNKVFSLKFEGMPEYPNGTAYLHIDCGENGADSIEVVDGTAEIKRNVTQYEGEKEAYVEILADGDVVWHSDVIMVTVKRLPTLGKKIEQAYPTAFEQALAQTAADKAAAAKSAAEAAATAAGIVTEEAARQNAENKRVAAETARGKAEETRAENERLRENAENERVKAETARKTAETNREQAEAAREKEIADVLSSVAGVENTVQANEQQRVLAERTRAAQEQARQSAEQSRVEAEQARAQAEQRRETAETSRAEAERQRESMETSRQTAETARNAAENGRAKAEKARETAESKRQQAETARADAEGKRVQAEQGRVTAEQGRVEAEAQREEAMAQHAEKIAELEEEVAKKAQIDDTTVSGSEAWSSQHIVDMLCPPLEASGNPVVCYPVAGSKLGVTASWEPTQEGEGTPSPDNIRPIHGRDSVKLERCGENLLNIAPFTKLTKSGVTYEYVANGGVHISGTATANVDSPTFAVGHLPPGKYYGLDMGTGIAASIVVQRKGSNGYLWLNAKGVFEILAGDIIKYWYMIANNGVTHDKTVYPYIVPGTTTPTTYTPYVGSTTTLTLLSTIYGGEVGADGAGQNMRKMQTLTGNEDWITWGVDKTEAGQTGFYCKIVSDAALRDDANIASHFGWKQGYAVHLGGTVGIGIAPEANPYLMLCVKDTLLDDISSNAAAVRSLKGWLAAQYAAGTPVQIAYKLATPVPFTATGGGTIKALSGTNTVLTDADALTVKGRADPIRIIQQLQAASAASAQALADVERAVTDI